MLSGWITRPGDDARRWCVDDGQRERWVEERLKRLRAERDGEQRSWGEGLKRRAPHRDDARGVSEREDA